MKRTLCITNEYPPKIGGVASYLFGLICELDQENIWVSTERSMVPFQASHTIFRTSFRHPVLRPRWLPALATSYRLAKRQQAEYLLAGEALPSGRIAFLLKRFSGTPYAVWNYGMDIPFALQHPRHARELREVLRGADRVFTISRFTRSLIRSIDSDIDPVILSPCPQEMEPGSEEKIRALKMRLGLEGKTVLLTVSRLVKRKGHSHVLRALQKLHRSDLVYLIVGDGPNRAVLEQRAVSSGLKKNVHFLGEVPLSELPLYYQASDIFCMINRELPNGDVEGFGIVFLEANMFGLPVIGGNNGGVPDAILDRKTGLLVNSENVDDIARAIAELADDPERRKRFGETGRERVKREFQYSIQARALKSHLSDL